MLTDLNRESMKVGFKMNKTKTEVVFNEKDPYNHYIRQRDNGRSRRIRIPRTVIKLKKGHES